MRTFFYNIYWHRYMWCIYSHPKPPPIYAHIIKMWYSKAIQIHVPVKSLAMILESALLLWKLSAPETALSSSDHSPIFNSTEVPILQKPSIQDTRPSYCLLNKKTNKKPDTATSFQFNPLLHKMHIWGINFPRLRYFNCHSIPAQKHLTQWVKNEKNPII